MLVFSVGFRGVMMNEMKGMMKKKKRRREEEKRRRGPGQGRYEGYERY